MDLLAQKRVASFKQFCSWCLTLFPFNRSLENMTECYPPKPSASVTIEMPGLDIGC